MSELDGEICPECEEGELQDEQPGVEWEYDGGTLTKEYTCDNCGKNIIVSFSNMEMWSDD